MIYYDMLRWLVNVGSIAFCSLYLCFVLYLAYVALWSAHRTGTLQQARWYVQCIAYVVLATMVGVDALVNITLGSLLFWELPGVHTILLTWRCAKWKYTTGWRGKLARWICDDWLDIFQDHHC